MSFTAEARVLVADQRVLSAAVYEGTAAIEDAREFVEKLVASGSLPDPAVVDAGLIAERGWAVVEFNAAWGSGLNGCAPEAMVECIVRATRRGPTLSPPAPTSSSA